LLCAEGVARISKVNKQNCAWKLRFLGFAVGMIAVALVGCIEASDSAGIPIEPANDRQVTGQIEVLSCEQIEVEYRVNTDVAAQRTDLDQANDVQNIFDRNYWLRQLALVKDCNTSSYPPQLAR
jgi:hypothetical protein